ncbi:MAG: hypothetical protein ABSF54_25745, partial [Bryobacteraceae bacterium]
MHEDLDPIAQLKFGKEIESICADPKHSSGKCEFFAGGKQPDRGASIFLPFEIQESSLIDPRCAELRIRFGMTDWRIHHEIAVRDGSPGFSQDGRRTGHHQLLPA